MKKLLTATAIVLIAASAACAAGKADTKNTQETASAPPQDAATYPCWDAMQDGHMQHMYGMMNGNRQMPPQGVKAHTCWDAMHDGHMTHMRNMQMMWNPPVQQK